MNANSFHFIVPHSFSPMLDLVRGPIPLKDFPYWEYGAFTWAAQSYLALRELREGVTIGTTPRAGFINFAHFDTFRKLGSRQGEFRVTARADRRQLFDTDFEILQNPTIPTGGRQAYLPHWPLPWIIPRDESRRSVRNIGYAGWVQNLDPSLREAALCDRYRIKVLEPKLWHDMSEVDIMIGIRSLDRALYDTKPPTKLFCSWLGHVPFIGGYDSAYSAVGDAGRDYIQVANRAELDRAVARLIDEPGYYEAIRDAGQVRSAECTRDKIAETWLKCFDGKISTAFERWKEQPKSRLKTQGSWLADQLLGYADGSKRRMSTYRQRLRKPRGHSG